MDQLDPSAVEEGVAIDEEGVGPLAYKCSIGRIDLTAGASVEHLGLQSQGASRRVHVFHRGFGSHGIGRIDEHDHTIGCRYQFTQEPLSDRESTRLNSSHLGSSYA